MVGGNAVHVAGLLGHAAKKVSSANDDGNLHAQRVNVGKFGCDLVNARRIYAEALISGESFARKFQQDAFKDGFRHVSDIIAHSKKGHLSVPLNHSGFCSGFEMATVSPASPTLKRAKRRTEMFSPSLPILVVISWEIVCVWSLMKGCSYKQTSS